jgi:hypothetical protein
LSPKGDFADGRYLRHGDKGDLLVSIVLAREQRMVWKKLHAVNREVTEAGSVALTDCRAQACQLR